MAFKEGVSWGSHPCGRTQDHCRAGVSLGPSPRGSQRELSVILTLGVGPALLGGGQCEGVLVRAGASPELGLSPLSRCFWRGHPSAQGALPDISARGGAWLPGTRFLFE